MTHFVPSFLARCSSFAFTAERIFPNCPRYLHKMQMVEYSAHAPRPDYTPPIPAWKTYEAFRDSLPARDRAGKEQK
jgi:hypothetical protein